MENRVINDEEIEDIDRIANACENYLNARNSEWVRDEQVRELRRQEWNQAALEVRMALDAYVDARVRSVLRQELEGRGGLLHGLAASFERSQEQIRRILRAAGILKTHRPRRGR